MQGGQEVAFFKTIFFFNVCGLAQKQKKTAKAQEKNLTHKKTATNMLNKDENRSGWNLS